MAKQITVISTIGIAIGAMAATLISENGRKVQVEATRSALTTLAAVGLVAWDQTVEIGVRTKEVLADFRAEVTYRYRLSDSTAKQVSSSGQDGVGDLLQDAPFFAEGNKTKANKTFKAQFFDQAKNQVPSVSAEPKRIAF